MLRWFTGVTGAEQSSLARQTCSLSDGMVIALMPHISITGVTGATWTSPLGWALLGLLHR